MNLREIEGAFPNVSMTVRGNEISLRGDVEECDRVEQLVSELLVVLRSGQDINPEVIKRSISIDRKSTRLNSSHSQQSRMPSSA